MYGKARLVSNDELIARHCVYAVIVIDDKIALQSTKSSGKLWFPGGKLDVGEQDTVGLMRETHEEMAIDIRIKNFLTNVESYFYYDPTDTAYRQLSSFYLCDFVKGDISSRENPDSDDEATNPQWYCISTIAEEQFQDYGWEIIKRYVLPSHKNVVSSAFLKNPS
jgi:8-oxo-dGTP pyrophosphatase MutT (NUDIX family)